MTDTAPTPATPPEVQVVQTARGPVGVRRRGRGRPYVLLHPLALSGACFAEVQAELAEHHDVIAVDLRGHGESGWDGRPFEIGDLVEDVVALLDELGLDEVDLAGLSLGGSVAIALAGAHPRRVTSLVAADTTSWYGEDAVSTWEARANKAASAPRTAQVPFQTDRWFTEEFRRSRPARVNDIVRCFLATDSDAHAATARAMGRMDSRSLLPDITAPVLAIVGAEDYATPPAMAKATAGGVPEGRLLVLDGARHLSLVERPELAELLRAHAAGELVSAPDGADGARGCCAAHTATEEVPV